MKTNEINKSSFCKCGEFIGMSPKHPDCEKCQKIENEKKKKESRSFLRNFKGRMK